MSYRRDFDRDGERLRVQARHQGEDRFHIVVGDRSFDSRARLLPDGRVRFSVGEETFEVVAGDAGPHDLHVRLDGRTYTLLSHRGRIGTKTEAAADGIVRAPMTGTVLAIHVEDGQSVAEGDTVAVISAMKMERKLRADRTGTVADVSVVEGDSVEQGALILRVE